MKGFLCCCLGEVKLITQHFLLDVPKVDLSSGARERRSRVRWRASIDTRWAADFAKVYILYVCLHLIVYPNMLIPVLTVLNPNFPQSIYKHNI